MCFRLQLTFRLLYFECCHYYIHIQTVHWNEAALIEMQYASICRNVYNYILKDSNNFFLSWLRVCSRKFRVCSAHLRFQVVTETIQHFLLTTPTPSVRHNRIGPRSFAKSAYHSRGHLELVTDYAVPGFRCAQHPATFARNFRRCVESYRLSIQNK